MWHIEFSEEQNSCWNVVCVAEEPLTFINETTSSQEWASFSKMMVTDVGQAQVTHKQGPLNDPLTMHEVWPPKSARKSCWWIFAPSKWVNSQAATVTMACLKSMKCNSLCWKKTECVTKFEPLKFQSHCNDRECKTGFHVHCSFKNSDVEFVTLWNHLSRPWHVHAPKRECKPTLHGCLTDELWPMGHFEVREFVALLFSTEGRAEHCSKSRFVQ